MTDDVNTLRAACLEGPSLNAGNCSGNVRYIAKKVGVPLPEIDANGLIEHFRKSNWKTVSETDAQSLADKGHLVIAGKAALTGSGHVVVIAPGGMVRSGGYSYKDKSGQPQTAAFHGLHPRASSAAAGGWPGGISKSDKSVFDSWGNVKNYLDVKFWSAP